MSKIQQFQKALESKQSKSVIRSLLPNKARWWQKPKIDLEELNRGWLLLAMHFHRVDVMQLLIDEGASLDVRDEHGNFPLHLVLAIPYYHREQAILLLLTHKVDVNAVNHDGDTVLHLASDSGLDSIVQLLMKNGANVNVMNRFGSTPLHFAAYYGYLSVVKYLIEVGGASILIQDRSGNTALHYAAMMVHPAAVVYLVKRCPETVLIKNGEGKVPSEMSGEGTVQSQMLSAFLREADRQCRQTVLPGYGRKQAEHVLSVNTDTTVAAKDGIVLRAKL